MKKGKIIFFRQNGNYYTWDVVASLVCQPKGTARALEYEKRCNFGEVALKLLLMLIFFVENEIAISCRPKSYFFVFS